MSTTRGVSVWVFELNPAIKLYKSPNKLNKVAINNSTQGLTLNEVDFFISRTQMNNITGMRVLSTNIKRSPSDTEEICFAETMNVRNKCSTNMPAKNKDICVKL